MSVPPKGLFRAAALCAPALAAFLILAPSSAGAAPPKAKGKAKRKPAAAAPAAPVKPAPPPLGEEAVVRRVVPDGAGGERQEDWEKAEPGDTISYVVTFTNGGKKDVVQAAGVLPVPPGMVYLEGTADPPDFEATTDGSSFAPPAGRKAAEFRALRWTVKDLAPGNSFTVRARMKILPAAP